MTDIQKLIQTFATEIVAAAKREALAEFVAKFNGPLPSAPGATPPRSGRRKGPKQLCPVPGCKSPAAPVFSMLCSKHKATPKRLVAKYRAARRAAKGR